MSLVSFEGSKDRTRLPVERGRVLLSARLAWTVAAKASDILRVNAESVFSSAREHGESVIPDSSLTPNELFHSVIPFVLRDYRLRVSGTENVRAATDMMGRNIPVMFVGLHGPESLEPIIHGYSVFLASPELYDRLHAILRIGLFSPRKNPAYRLVNALALLCVRSIPTISNKEFHLDPQFRNLSGLAMSALSSRIAKGDPVLLYPEGTRRLTESSPANPIPRGSIAMLLRLKKAGGYVLRCHSEYRDGFDGKTEVMTRFDPPIPVSEVLDAEMPIPKGYERKYQRIGMVQTLGDFQRERTERGLSFFFRADAYARGISFGSEFRTVLTTLRHDPEFLAIPANWRDWILSAAEVPTGKERELGYKVGEFLTRGLSDRIGELYRD